MSTATKQVLVKENQQRKEDEGIKKQQPNKQKRSTACGSKQVKTAVVLKLPFPFATASAERRDSLAGSVSPCDMPSPLFSSLDVSVVFLVFSPFPPQFMVFGW
jgi:hypothetical protein